jgi:CheY-like chemotaxis protein
MIYNGRAGADCVLLVDDDPMLLATTQSVLERGGFRVATCSTPEEALERCGHPPRVRVILTRLAFRASRMTGIELAALAARTCGANAILTDSHDPVLLHAFPGFEERAFLQQPYSPAQVLSAVADAWASRRRSTARENPEPEEGAG